MYLARSVNLLSCSKVTFFKLVQSAKNVDYVVFYLAVTLETTIDHHKINLSFSKQHGNCNVVLLLLCVVERDFPKKKQIPWLVSAMYVRLLGGQVVDVV